MTTEEKQAGGWTCPQCGTYSEVTEEHELMAGNFIIRSGDLCCAQCGCPKFWSKAAHKFEDILERLRRN